MSAIKRSTLVALVALTAIALVGVGSAMAESTALCKVDETPCASGNRISHVHETTSSKATVLSPVEVKCDVLYLGDVEVGGNLSSGTPLQVLGHLTYTNCVRENGKSCEVTETGAHALIAFQKSEHELAGVTYAHEVNVHCGLLINCTYSGEGLEGHALGSLLSTAANGEVRLEEKVLQKVKGLCPEETKLDILITPLVKTYIST